MTNAKRGRGSRRGFYFCIVAALGLALSACGGGSTAGVASTAASSTATQSTPATASVGSGTATSSTSTSGTATSGTATSGTVTSGTSTSSSPPTASSAAVTINWTPPTENVDGTPLTNLAGYNIHYGTTSGNYTQTIAVSNPGIASYVVQSLAPGTYYFVVAAVNSSGTESPLSSQVSATVN